MSSLESLRQMEAGLRAELEVLRVLGSEYLKQDGEQQQEQARALDLKLDMDLAALHEMRDFLLTRKQEGEANLSRALASVRALSRLNSDVDKQEDGDADDENMLAQQVKQMRRRALQFAKAQYPVAQAEDEFAGGDFWDACVAHCADQDEHVDFAEREAGFAELLVQSGLFARTGGDGKRIRLVPQAFE